MLIVSVAGLIGLQTPVYANKRHSCDIVLGFPVWEMEDGRPFLKCCALRRAVTDRDEAAGTGTRFYSIRMGAGTRRDTGPDDLKAPFEFKSTSARAKCGVCAYQKGIR